MTMICLVRLILSYTLDVYQIDFIIPLSKYESELESIESSIGTITYKGKL